MFEFSYKKNKNDSLFKDFENKEMTNLVKCQNYIPIYSTYFSLNEKNWNSINLNNSKIIQGIHSKINENTYNIQLKKGKLTNSFFKFSPLIDPIKYMFGNYKDLDVSTIMTLPSIKQVNTECENIHERIVRKNNVSYVDGFFSYLSNKIKQEHGFINGIDFYGSFLGIKNNFHINIYDDLDYLTESQYFFENKNKLFTIDDSFHDLLSNASRNNKKALDIKDIDIDIDNYDTEIPDLVDEIFSTTTKNDTSLNSTIMNLNEINLCDEEIIQIFDLPKSNITPTENANDSNSSDDDFSSFTSKTSSSDDKTTNSKESEINYDCSYSSSSDSFSTLTNENVNAVINQIPVQAICIEKLNDTLDSYMLSCDICNEEWKGILLQIIFTLITYQKAFDFTHNDLHTNNIMFNETDEEYIIYKYKHEYYKVPTYGKIWKIIDYGRAIYTFKGKQIISDSYHKNEDAGTQYNFEPYYNPNKPIIEPNKSFDLCRLGCSLFDYFFDSIDEVTDCDDEISLLIAEWCNDDNKKNVLYKANGRERYMGFKLYKMIARSVHNHRPEIQIKNKLFNIMKVKRRSVHKSSMLIDIDRIPSYKE